MAGMCADVVTCENVETHAGACLNAPATSLVASKMLAALFFISRKALENSSIGLTTAPSLSRVMNDPGL